MVPLKSRSFLRVEGPTAQKFLQNLSTNNFHDLKPFESIDKSVVLEKDNVFYSHFLNDKGRFLFDAFVVQLPTEVGSNHTSYLLECHSDAVELVKQHFQKFNLRKSVKISDVSEEYQVWVGLAPKGTTDSTFFQGFRSFVHDASVVLPPEAIPGLLYPDPRVSLLGFRAVLPAGCNGKICTCVE